MNKALQNIADPNLSQTQQDLLAPMIETISTLTESRSSNFTGTCILSYNDAFEKEKTCSCLRPNIAIPRNLKLGTDKFVDFLLSITQYESTLHDGFVLTDSSGTLSHVSQFVQVNLNDSLKPHSEFGTRYYSALLATKISGVELVGNVSTTGKGMIFIDGNAFFLN